MSSAVRKSQLHVRGEIDRCHPFPRSQIVADLPGLRGGNPIGDADTGPTPVQPHHQARTGLTAAMVPRPDTEPAVASPVLKQHFLLRTGRCIEDDSVAIDVFPVRVRNGRVTVGVAGP